MGQYTAGALLIREALLRWRKGWGSGVLLALAYGVTEEGLGDNTLFNSTHGADGVLGSFGRFAGVNWVWSTGVLAFHVVYSIGLPLVLLGLTVPATRGRPLLSRRGVVVALASLALSTSIESALVYRIDHFWLGAPLLVGCFVVIAALVAAAYRLPSWALQPATKDPSARPWQVGVVGFAFFPAALLLEYGFAGTATPAALVVLLELAVFGGLLELVRRGIGRRGNEHLRVHLAFGFILWQSLFGVLLTLGLPYTLPLVVVAVVYFLRLRRQYAPRGTSLVGPVPPPGALETS